jgi:CheY-like chemotaxis protein
MNELQPKKILIVDDEPDTVSFLTMLFEDSGYDVVSTTTSENLPDMIREHSPDVITLDIMMPGKTGIKAFRELRRNPDFKDIPVVIVSGVNIKKFIDQSPSIEEGAETIPPPHAFVEKPVDSTLLISTLKNLF